jgi:nucleoside-diphosphate-sugar epimerase
MQAILGANGVIGRELSKQLLQYTTRIRQVSRAPHAVNASDELVSADLLDARATTNAVAGCEIAYLVAGLPYDTRVWQEQWPRLMRHAIDACKRHSCALVFFDNVYAYGRVNGVMTEDTPYNPCSRKGEVRARIASTLMGEVKRGGLRAMIVRGADFYGPGAVLSLPHATVTSRLRARKTPQWIGNAHAQHTFTYTPDAGLTLARLGNMSSAPCRLQVAPRWLLALMGLFVPVLRENREMMYQFECDYRFDSSKAERALGLTATAYRAGIAATLAE